MKQDQPNSAPDGAANPTVISRESAYFLSKAGHLDPALSPDWYRRFKRTGAASKTDRAADYPQPEPGEALRILIVDDDRHVAAMLARLLRDLQTHVTTNVAHEGETALELIEIVRPHVVLLDLMMPGISGFELCEQITNSDKFVTPRIIAMTGYNQATNVERALEAGAECCLAKPFENYQLLELLGLHTVPPRAPDENTDD